jgi:soluble lytic murein transglycosylase
VPVFILGLLWCTAWLGAPAAAAQTSRKKTTAHAAKSKSSHKKSGKKRTMSPRVRRMRQAFVASADLRPMARQLLQDRTPAAYAGVEAYARRHAKEDAGALAWLVVGSARILDGEYAKAVDPLNRAKPRAGDLGDYVTYYLGKSYLQTGKSAEALATLTGFDAVYPDSLLARDAHIVYASALLAEGRPLEAAELLEQDRKPARRDVELMLGRAYSAAGQPGKAAPPLRLVYYTMPLSPEADEAWSELKKIAGQIPAPGLEERRTRADVLFRGKRYSDAAREYQDLLDQVIASDRPGVQLALATAYQRSGRNREGRQLLEAMPDATGEVNAQRLYLLGEVARASDKDEDFGATLGQLRQAAPTSPWLEQALLSAGNLYLLRRDYDRAIDFYRELQQRFPNGGRASYAHWKAAWLNLRQLRMEEAKSEFDQQIALYPTSPEVPAALYWRARLAEEEGEMPKAQAYYQALSARFRNYYYADLARQRLRQIQADPEPVRYAALDRLPVLESTRKVTATEPPDDNLRVQKARLLGNGALLELAARELQAAAAGGEDSWVPAEVARLFRENERYDRALEVMKRAVPNYFALDIAELPRSYWEALFPRPYWTDLRKYAAVNRLEPYLVASLIRQESAFNPNALSRANAVGLMQLLPKTGKTVAREVKLKHFQASQLYVPATNLQLGTRYFRAMIDQFGALEYALAAYNAGADRVEDWQAQGKYRDVQEFVESIPFTETREYVQAILRNANVYKQLYGTP